MKVLAGLVLGVLAALGIGAGAIAMGIVNVPFFETQRDVLSSPTLQPLATPTAGNSDMVVTLSERYLNRQVAAGMARGGQVRDLQLDVHDSNRADVNATVQVNSVLMLKPKIALVLSAQNGRIVIDVQKVDVGGFGIPSSAIEPQIAEMKQSAEGELNAQLVALAASARLRLQGLSTTENSLTLDFVQ